MSERHWLEEATKLFWHQRSKFVDDAMTLSNPSTTLITRLKRHPQSHPRPRQHDEASNSTTPTPDMTSVEALLTDF